MTMSLGERIRELRQKHDFSQQQLAEKIGLAKTIVWKYEKGQAVPSADVVKRIAVLFEVSTDFLIFDESERGNSPAISDKRLVKRFEEVAKMDQEDREFIIKAIDYVVKKNGELSKRSPKTTSK